MHHLLVTAALCLLLACTRKPFDPDVETGSSAPAATSAEAGSSTPTTGPGSSEATTAILAETSTTQSEPPEETEPPTGYAMTGETECGYNAGPLGKSCHLLHYCDDDSFNQSVICDSEVCTCFQDDVEFRQCPNEGFCLIEDDLAARNEGVNKCCGFMWYVG